jgi:hypothetical protein
VKKDPRRSKSDIPNKYHFIFALTPDSKPFLFLHFLAVASCRAINRPNVIHFYCKYEPSGLWWERAKPYLTVVHVEPRVEIFGNRLSRPEHMADVMRLEILLDQGGIYMDIDVLSVRPFTPLLHFKTVLGEEIGVGLCNAVILARSGARFLRTWLDEYKSFNGADWNGHSVRLPLRLSHENPGQVHVVDHRRFFWPTYRRADLRAFFLHRGSQFCKRSYCTHLWESLTWPFVKRITPAYVFGVESEFCALARPYVRAEWLHPVANALVNQPWPSNKGAKSPVGPMPFDTLRASIAFLPPECREAVILCGLIGMPADEGAVLLECTAEKLVSNFHLGCDLLERVGCSLNALKHSL